jgi:hypothetical protein
MRHYTNCASTLGNLAAGNYTFNLQSWGMPVQTQPFSVGPDKIATIALATLERNGCFKLRVDGIPGVTYVIQTSTNLRAWTAVATNLGGPFDWEDPAFGQFERRFYRVAIGP